MAKLSINNQSIYSSPNTRNWNYFWATLVFAFFFFFPLSPWISRFFLCFSSVCLFFCLFLLPILTSALLSISPVVPLSMISSSSSFYRFIFIFSVILSIRFVSSASLCPQDSVVFLNNLQSQCPPGISPNPPFEVRFLIGY